MRPFAALASSAVLATSLTVAAGIAPAGAVVGSATAPTGGWKVVASYCSDSGDVCFGIKRKGDLVRFRLDSFVDFGPVDFCVRKGTYGQDVCQSRALIPGAHDLYHASILWNGNYPDGGRKVRHVSFAGYPNTLAFKP